MRLHAVLAVAVCLVFSAAANAQRGKLNVGDSAPGLDIEKWVKGDETSIESGYVYVVEFWATWCGPCKKSIPHLTKLQQEFKDDGLRIIGISNEELAPVETFVRRQGKKMDYIVAVDRRAGTKRAWFDAAGRKGIPSAFIVDQQGKVAWIGNPLDPAFDETLRQVMGGRFNARLMKEAEPKIKQARTARKVRNYRMASRHYDELIEVDPRIFAFFGLEKFEMLLVDMNDRERAYEYARNELLGRHYVDDYEAILMLGKKIVSDHKLDDHMRDMDVALEAAEMALEIKGEHDAKVLSAMAGIYYERGEMQKAYETQLKAWKLAKTKHKAEFRRTLDQYRDALEGS